MTRETGRESGRDGPGPVDLTALDPAADAEAFERFVRGICRAAGAELLRRRSRPSLEDLIIHWRRPIMAAVLVIALVSGSLIMTARQSPVRCETALAESLGVPRVWAGWIHGDEHPGPGQLLEADGSEP
jgi:hypothetical protein